MQNELQLKYLVLQEAIEEVSGQEPDNVGSVFAKCRYCDVSIPIKQKNFLPHKENCPAIVSFTALSKAKVLDIELGQE